MADLRMDGVTVSGAIRFENVTLEVYNKLIALLDGINREGDARTEPTVPPQNPPEEPKKARSTRELRAVQFGAKLREIREKHELTRKELSSLIGYAAVTIRTWEIGASVPSNLAVDALRKVFTEESEELNYLLPTERK